MSPEYQTLITMFAMIVGWFWGHAQGKIKGIETCLIFYERQGIITYIDEPEEDEEENDE
jgi:hypothetical protein